MLDKYAIKSLGKITLPDDSPDVPTTRVLEGTWDRQVRYSTEDHDRAMGR